MPNALAGSSMFQLPSKSRVKVENSKIEEAGGVPGISNLSIQSVKD